MPYENSKSYSGQGTKLEFCLVETSPIVYKELDELVDFQPTGKWEMDDPTNLASTVREKKPVLFDAGGFTSTVNRVSTNEAQQLIQSAYAGKKLCWIKATIAPNVEAGQSTGDVLLYKGYVVQNDPEVQVAKRVVNKFEVQFTARVSVTYGS